MQRGTTLGVLILAAALAACNGFPDLVPAEEARTRPPEPLVEQTARVLPEPPAGLPAEISGVAGRTWVIAARDQRLPASALRPAGLAVAGREVYVLTWDEPPYERLFVPSRPGVYVEYRELWQ
ncbi:MAG: hypothetical protein DIU52_008555 [bacterium]|jgi:hypothetical protein|nr:MAG: hypothetical protein DIU52_08080 [bacterium]